jgi:hypothetical protein
MNKFIDAKASQGVLFMKASKFVLGIALLGLCAAAAFSESDHSTSTSSDNGGIAARARQGSYWRSLDLTAQTLAAGPIPAAWDAGLFLDLKTLDAIISPIDGTIIRRGGGGILAGTSVYVRSVRLKPEAGILGAEVDLVAEKSGISLPLTVAANVTYQGIAEDPSGKLSVLTLRIEPTGISSNSLLNAAEHSFLTAVVPDLLVLFADPHVFEVHVPLPNQLEVPLGLQKEQTIPVNGGAGTVSIAASMEKGTVTQRLAYGGIVFGDDGIWLLAKVDDTGTPKAATKEPPADLAELKKAVEALRTSVASSLGHMSTSHAKSAELYIGKATFLALAEKLRLLDPGKRRVTFKTTGQSGYLAGKRQSLGILGNLGVQAVLLDNDAGSGSIQFDFGQASWTQKTLTIPVSATMNAEAKIQLNVDVIASGAVRTSVGVVGQGGGAMTASAKPILAGSGDGGVAAIEFSGSCSTVGADIKTDGVLKTDFGWTKVPSIGGRISSPVGPLPPVLVLNRRPYFVRVPKKSFGDWSVTPPHPAAVVSLTPSAFTGSDEGFELAIHFAATSVDIKGPQVEQETDAAEKETRDRAEQTSNETSSVLKNIVSAPCPGSSEFALLLGDLEFGSNNDLVRLFVLVGRLPQEALETVQHLGKEVSIEKVKGWIDDPKGSLERGEFGKVAGRVGHELSTDKVKEWAKDPGTSFTRSTPGQILTNPIGAAGKLFGH